MAGHKTKTTTEMNNWLDDKNEVQRTIISENLILVPKLTGELNKKEIMLPPALPQFVATP